MSILDDVRVRDYFRLLNSIGKAALNSLHPNEFEYYLISLELVDSDGKTVDFLSFPINPDSLSEKEVNPVSIQKTAGGITTLNSSTYNPVSINLSGSFGRRIKFLIGRSALDFVSVNFGNKQDKPFSNEIKTGYGTIKVLENILALSKTVDKKGKPYQLYFYNQALGNNYIVKFLDKEFKQSVSDSNMIWNYNLTLQSVAPLNGSTKSLKSKSINNLISTQIISKSVDITYNSIRALI